MTKTGVFPTGSGIDIYNDINNAWEVWFLDEADNKKGIICICGQIAIANIIAKAFEDVPVKKTTKRS